MSVHRLTLQSFNETLADHDLVLVDCWASWCNSCKDFTPIFESAAARHPEIHFATLDTENETELVEAMGIHHIPTLVLFRDGILLFKQPGHFEDVGLGSIISQAQSLDMDHVRAEMAAETAEESSKAKSTDETLPSGA
jgi:thioredoxin 1